MNVVVTLTNTQSLPGLIDRAATALVNARSEANRKLSESQCDEIRSRIAAGETSASLAAEFGVHRTTIQKVKAGRYLSLHQRDEGVAHE